MFDEGNFGANSSVSKGPQQPHGRSQDDRIKEKLPAQTVWNKGAKQTRSWKKTAVTTKRGKRVSVVMKSARKVMKSSMKKTPMKVAKKSVMKTMKRGPDKHQRGSNWVMCCVEVGSIKGGRKTHADGTKRSVFSLLPKPLFAEGGKPRGWQEMQKALAKHVQKKSILVKDGWKASTKAVGPAKREMKWKLLPPVIHQKWFRDPKTGVHTNDAESEIARVKGWMRKKAFTRGRAKNSDSPDSILQCHLDEFMFLKNMGKEMSTVMAAFVFTNQVKHRAVCI